ncbi:ParA family protein [Chromohalobacter israelensis]|uniref:ParA family protein n=1 Tax=Chromohalobacter israelensis TaxID=141390 RepID=UPI003AF43EB6
MSVYTLWNNKGGVGKSYLTFQLASEYANQNRDKRVIVIDMCPQANSSSMLLGGIRDGERNLEEIFNAPRRRTISGYIDERITSPYVNTNAGANYLTPVNRYNPEIPDNVYLVVGDDRLELQTSQVQAATTAGPQDSWRLVHLWIRDLIVDAQQHFPGVETTFFIDCNPSFSIYTTISLAASDRLILPFSADGSSKRAVRSVLSLVYGETPAGQPQSEYYRESMNNRMTIPKIYMYVGNRLTQMNNSSASAFNHVVTEITDEIWRMWGNDPANFQTHPNGAQAPTSKKSFKKMFLYEVKDANTASVFSGATGTPVFRMSQGVKDMNGKNVTINQSQLDKQQPNIRDLVAAIE